MTQTFLNFCYIFMELLELELLVIGRLFEKSRSNRLLDLLRITVFLCSNERKEFVGSIVNVGFTIDSTGFTT